MKRHSRRTTNSVQIWLITGILILLASVAITMTIGWSKHQEKGQPFSGPTFLEAVSRLELAELRTTETLDEKVPAHLELPWIGDVLGWTGSEAHLMIRFQAVYTFTVDLKEEWSFTSLGEKLVAQAPPLIAKNPSIDTASIEKFSDGGWLVPGQEEHLEALQKSLTEVAHKRAPEKLSLVLETSRRQLEKFLVEWADREDSGIRAIEVRFANEPLLENQPVG